MSAVAEGGTIPKQVDGWMWDLTVPGNNDHDFYVVMAGDVTGASILVHNDGCGITDYSSHAMTRMSQRGISQDQVEDIVARGRQSKGNQAGTFKYTLGKIYVITNKVRGGRVITVEWK